MVRNLWLNGLSGHVKSDRAMDWASSLPALLRALRDAHAETVAFADCAFPRHILTYADPDAALLRLPKGGDLNLFHATFHVAGSGDPIAECTARVIEKLATGRRLWLFVDDLAKISPLLPVLERLGVCLFCLQDGNRAPDTANWTAISTKFDDGTPTGFLLFMPREIFRTSRFAVAADQPQRGWSQKLLQPADDMPSFAINADRAHLADMLLSASRVITDNAYHAEREELWSWMWIGPVQIARFAVGRVPQGANRLEIHFISSERNQSLKSNLAVQLDGRGAAHHGMFAPDGSGRAWVELGDTPFTILSLACRTQHHVGDRILRACIAGIGFAA